jgi:predicted NAD/FAD-binding protein
MRIAVIGAGIAGNAAAWALATGSSHAVTVYEAGPRAGGHSATVEVDYDGARIAVDTGFMVYNAPNYPEFCALLDHLGVQGRPADMSFSVSVDGGRYEWSGRAAGRVGGFFAQRRNLVSAGHLRMLGDILRFNRRAAADLAAGRLAGLSLGDYLAGGGYSARFRDDYLLAMGAAIWSTTPARMLEFPAQAFVAFCDNHRLLHLSRPVWRTVDGGSRTYVERMTAAFRGRLRLRTPVRTGRSASWPTRIPTRRWCSARSASRRTTYGSTGTGASCPAGARPGRPGTCSKVRAPRPPRPAPTG